MDFLDFTDKIEVPNLSKLVDAQVLVTGGSGLIGNHLLVALKRAGANITVLQHINKPHIEDGILFLREDQFGLGGKFEYIFHLAGYGQPAKFDISTAIVNTSDLVFLSHFLRKDGTIFFASTSEIYSGLSKWNTRETDPGITTPEHKRAIYIESKRCGEAILHYLSDQFEDINVKIGRISLAYGPGVSFFDTRVMSDFIRSGLLNGIVKPKGGLNNERVYCYVSDMITMILNVVLNGTQRVYNLNGNGFTSIGRLAKTIAEITNAKLELIDSEGDKSAPEFVAINSERYLNEFGHHNFVPLTEGLEKTVDWFKLIYDKGK